MQDELKRIEKSAERLSERSPSIYTQELAALVACLAKTVNVPAPLARDEIDDAMAVEFLRTWELTEDDPDGTMHKDLANLLARARGRHLINR